MKCNQSYPGFELVSPCPFPTSMTITPRAPPVSSINKNICKNICIKWSLLDISHECHSTAGTSNIKKNISQMIRHQLYEHISTFVGYLTPNPFCGTIMKIINYSKLLEIKPTQGEWKQGFKKTKRGGYIVQTPKSSYKDNTLLFT